MNRPNLKPLFVSFLLGLAVGTSATYYMNRESYQRIRLKRLAQDELERVVSMYSSEVRREKKLEYADEVIGLLETSEVTDNKQILNISRPPERRHH